MDNDRPSSVNIIKGKLLYCKYLMSFEQTSKIILAIIK